MLEVYTRNSPMSSQRGDLAPRHRVERLGDIVNQVGQVLEPDREADQPVADAVPRPLLRAVGGVRHAGGGCTRVSASPRLTARVTSASRFMKARPAFIPSLSSQAMRPPGRLIWRRARRRYPRRRRAPPRRLWGWGDTAPGTPR